MTKFPTMKTCWSLVLVLGVLMGATTIALADVKAGDKALAEGDLTKALREYQDASSKGKAEGQVGVGRVYFRQLKFDEAMAAFKQAEQMDPALAAAYAGQGDVLRRLGNTAGAVQLYQKAVALDRKYPEASLALGACLSQLGRHAEAVEALSPGLKWGSEWRPKFLVALGDAELARDSLRDAGVYYTRAREESPNDPAAHAALGRFYVARGIPGLAVPEYQKAVALDTSRVEFRHGLGEALFYDKRTSEALQEYEYVYRRDPTYAPNLLSLGYLYYLLGPVQPDRYADAKPPLERYVELEPGSSRGWSVLGRVLFFLGEKDRAYDYLTKSIEMGETSKDTYTILGRVYTERKEWDKALAAFNQGEPDARDQLRIAQIYTIVGRAAAAESLYLSMVETDSTSKLSWFALNQLGKAQFREKEYDAAIGTFERRNALDPNSGEAYYFMGLAYKELKQYPEALTALRRASKLDTDQPDRFFWLGIMYAQEDSIPQARAAFERSVQFDSTSVTASVAFRQIGFYLLLEDDCRNAIDQLEKSVAINESDAQAWVWLGQAYQNCGDRQHALDAYGRALELDPNQPDALNGRRTLTEGAQ